MYLEVPVESESAGMKGPHTTKVSVYFQEPELKCRKKCQKMLKNVKKGLPNLT